jgi:hypothetical protein
MTEQNNQSGDDEIYPGTCLLLPKVTNPIPHLWIVLTEIDYAPSVDTSPITPPVVVMVNLTSLRERSDTTVVLNKGDHPFITKPTSVFYDDTSFTSVTDLKEIVKLPKYDFHYDCSEQLLKRIQQGLLISPYADPEIQDYCRAFF